MAHFFPILRTDTGSSGAASSRTTDLGQWCPLKRDTEVNGARGAGKTMAPLVLLECTLSQNYHKFSNFSIMMNSSCVPACDTAPHHIVSALSTPTHGRPKCGAQVLHPSHTMAKRRSIEMVSRSLPEFSTETISEQFSSFFRVHLLCVNVTFYVI